ncbi:hypothetical protein SLA2020_288400 [Shorea laevis]
MGNYRFRFSDMIPNAWFYKLKDMGRTRNHFNKTKKHQQTEPPKPKQPHHQGSYPRKSYYFSRDLVSHDRFCNSPKSTDPPRKSSRRIRSRKVAAARASPKLVASPVSPGCSGRATLWTKPDDSPPPEYSASYSSDGSLGLEIGESFPPEFRTDRILTTESFDDMVAWSRSDAKDIVIDVQEIELPPIITKPEKLNDSVKDLKKKDQKEDETTNYHRSSLPVKVMKAERITMKEQRNTAPVRKLSSNSPGFKLRINSPRIASRKIQAHARKSVSSTSSSGSRRSLSDSLAVVKSSFDPQRDFRESMVEMIVQNNIRASKDLEDLLACYLTLNSDEYHDLIIKVFKQIWFDLSDQAQLKL